VKFDLSFTAVSWPLYPLNSVELHERSLLRDRITELQVSAVNHTSQYARQNLDDFYENELGHQEHNRTCGTNDMECKNFNFSILTYCILV